MKYENAKELLPEALLKEVQKYAGGKLLYIPVENESKSWGEASGYRQKLLKRNVMISNRYKSGATLSELAEEYFLSLDSIKKIVYGKKEKNLLFEPTVESAICYANAGLLEEWLTLYYNAFRDNEKISFDGVICCGVMKVPIRLLEDCTDASTEVECHNGNPPEPLIITYRDGKFEVSCQQELYYVLKQKKVNAYPALLMVQKEEYKQFERQFGRYFISVFLFQNNSSETEALDIPPEKEYTDFYGLICTN